MRNETRQEEPFEIRTRIDETSKPVHDGNGRLLNEYKSNKVGTVRQRKTKNGVEKHYETAGTKVNILREEHGIVVYEYITYWACTEKSGWHHVRPQKGKKVDHLFSEVIKSPKTLQAEIRLVRYRDGVLSAPICEPVELKPEED